MLAARIGRRVTTLHHDQRDVAHWYRPRNVEDWRASAHRLLADLGENERTARKPILSFLVPVEAWQPCGTFIGRCVPHASQ